MVEPARPEDDAAIQALLATRPMSGWMQLIATTQPSFFQALAWEGIRADAFVARQANQVVGLCSRVVQSFYFQGTPCQLGYLGHLRTHPQLKGQIKPIQAGFQACFQAHTATEQAFDITSILSENREARRLLEANLPGLPVYRPLREWTTLIFSVRHLTRLPSKAVALLPDQVEAYRHVLKEHFRSFGLASSWSHHLERGICPPLEQSCWLGCPNQIEATAALWDISAVKQTRVVGYRPGIAWTLPLLNGVLRLLGQPLLPKPGQALRMGYICQWSVQDEHGEQAMHLLGFLGRLAHQLGLDYLILGLDAERSLTHEITKRLPHRAISSQIYTVQPQHSAPTLPDPNQAIHLENCWL